MNNHCEKYRKFIIDQILWEDNKECLDLEHKNDCSECKNYEQSLQKLNAELLQLADHLGESLPTIDVADKILKKIESVREQISLIKQITTDREVSSDYANWYAYIEDELDEVTKYRCEIKLQESTPLLRELSNYKKIHESLFELAEYYKQITLEMDLSPSILEKVSEMSRSSELSQIKEQHDLEKELYELSEVIDSVHMENDLTLSVVRRDTLNSFDSRTVTEKKSRDKIISLNQHKKWNKIISMNRYLIPVAVSAMILITLGIFYLLNRLDYMSPDKFSSSQIIKRVRVPEFDRRSIQNPSEENRLMRIESGQFAMDDNLTKPSVGKTLGKKSYVEGMLNNWLAQLKDNALINAGKLMRMGVWMSLSPEEARYLLQQSGLSPEAILGAVQFLPPEEAKVVLQAAIENNPEDAYLRFVMVQTLRKISGESIEEDIENHLLVWKQLDPSNSLPYFVEAERNLEKGDLPKAVECLKAVSKTTGYNNYAQITAKAYMESLLAKGIEPELAKLLASASMGLRELQNLDELVQSLAEYGKFYEDIGDYQTALLIYDALRNLGLKVDMSSNLLQERLAGIKYTQEAINAMVRLMGMVGKLEDAQSLMDFTRTVGEMILNYSLALENFYRLFDTNNIAEIIDLINNYLTHGNVIYTPNIQANP